MNQPNKSSMFNQTLSSFICCLTTLSLGLSIGWSSSAFHKIQNMETGFTLDGFQQSLVVSFLNIGVIFGSIPTSFLMDKVGRKNALLYTSILSLVQWILIATADCPLMLYWGRFLGGIFSGIAGAIAPIYVAENVDPHVRGALGTLFSIMLYAGILFIDVVGPLVSYTNLSLFCGSITVIFMLTFPFMPETPYFYLIKNREDEARAALLWLRGLPEVEDELKVIEKFVEAEKKNSGKWSDIFLDETSRATLVSCLFLAFVQKFSGFFTVISYQTVILPAMVGPLTSEAATLVIGVVLLITVTVSAFIVDKVGRIPLLHVSYVGIITSMIFTGIWFYMNRAADILYINHNNLLPFLGFVVFVIFFSIGLGPVTNMYAGEVLPLLVKAKAMSFAISVAALFTAINTEIFALLNESIGMYANYFSFAAVSALGLFYTKTFIVETKGKSLQMIQEEFHNKAQQPKMKGDYVILP